jgi:large subunit ribosomal protein L27
MGRDHTIYATHPGYVKYYRDPEKHPKRKYIGIVFERDQVLPLPRNAMRRRRLGMVATKMETRISDSGSQVQVQTGEHGGYGTVEVGVHDSAIKRKRERRGEEGRNLTLRPGYMYREGNWEIGRAAERANVKVRKYNRRDRWAAWRKATKKKAMRTVKLSLSKKKAK